MYVDQLISNSDFPPKSPPQKIRYALRLARDVHLINVEFPHSSKRN